MSEHNFIADGLTNVELVNIITELQTAKNEVIASNDNDKYEKLKEKYSLFATRYPMLFEMAIKDGDFDWVSFNYMINMRNKIINNELSVEKASEVVGKEWFNKYVDVSKMGSPNKKQKK